MKRLKSLILILAVFGVSLMAQKRSFCIPLLNNTYLYNNPTKKVVVGKNGLLLPCSQTGSYAKSYFFQKKDQESKLLLEIKGKGSIEVSLENVNGKKTTKRISINSKDFKERSFCYFKTKADGYVHVTYKPITVKEDIVIKSLKIVSTCEPIFLSENFNTHFGLRGPSCHLAYNTGKHNDIEWVLIDVLVPEEFDKTGSYYMALGFSGGYFGMQNNSESRRQVLFSVWNSVDDDNPENVSQEHRTQVIRCGKNVTAKDFGHEGSGKQTFIAVDWKPNIPYTFLLNAKKIDPSTTEYSAWFYNTLENEWIFMATLRRPDTPELLTGLHSFIENFNPSQGDKTRKAFYYNAWYKPVNENWIPISEAYLTNDLTGSKGVRLDFNGGIEDNKFFLMNGGYFDRPYKIERDLKCKLPHHDIPNINLADFIEIKK